MQIAGTSLETALRNAISGGYVAEMSGQTYTVTHVHIYRVVDGKIREHWAVRDDLSMLQQLGAIA